MPPADMKYCRDCSHFFDEFDYHSRKTKPMCWNLKYRDMVGDYRLAMDVRKDESLCGVYAVGYDYIKTIVPPPKKPSWWKFWKS